MGNVCLDLFPWFECVQQHGQRLHSWAIRRLNSIQKFIRNTCNIYDHEDGTYPGQDSAEMFLSPKNRVLKAWQWFLTFSIVITIILETFMAAFNSSQPVLWVLAYMCDVIYLMNIVVNFFLGYVHKGAVVTDRRLIRRRYLRTTFAVDILAVLPTDLIVVAFPGVSLWKTLTVCRMNRLIRFYRVWDFLETIEAELGTPTAILRSLKYFIVSLATTHVVTCAWYALSCEGIHEGIVRTCKPNTWATTFELGFNPANTTTWNIYILSLYWAVATATSTGYGDISAANVTEKWYSVLSMLAGIGVFFGMLLGGMTSMLTNFDGRRSRYAHRFSCIKRYLDDLKVADDLQKLVIGYYEYLWLRKKGMLQEGMFDVLPLTFQSEVSLVTNSVILEKAPLLKDQEQGFLRMLSLHVKPVMYMPGQIIMSRGEIANQMIYIHRGEVEVLSEEDDETAVVALKSGKIFGEVSLVFSLPRSATIRAATHCDVMTLSKDDLNMILEVYPDVCKDLQAQAKQRCSLAERILHMETDDVLTPIKEQLAYKAFKPPKTALVEPRNCRRHSFVTSPNFHAGVHHHHHRRTSVQITEAAEAFKTNSNAMEETMKDGADKPRKIRNNRFNQQIDVIKEWIFETTLDPTSDLVMRWETLIFIVSILQGLIYPYMACLLAYGTRTGFNSIPFGHLSLGVTYVMDLLLILDILVNLRTEIVTPKGKLEEFSDIARHYCLSSKFVLDSVAALPLEVFCVMVSNPVHRWRLFSYLKLNKMAKCFKVPLYFTEMEQKLGISIQAIRYSKLGVYIMLLSHWCCAVLFLSACHGETCVPGSWVTHRFSSVVNSTSAFTDYVTSLYWAAATMTSTGYGDIRAYTTLGRLLALLAMLVGLLLYGYSVSALAATLANADAERVHFQAKLFAVKKFMQKRNIDQTLIDRVIQYMCHLWEKYGGEWIPGQKPIMHDTPRVLQEDILVETALNTFGKTPLFRNTDESFMRELSLKITSYLFSPGDVIMYAGDVGHEMYCINRGYCEILGPDFKSVLATLGPGQYFGEIGLIFGNTRTATVRSKTHSEILLLHRDDLDSILVHQPLLKQQFDDVENNAEYLQELQEESRRALQRKESIVHSHQDVVKNHMELLEVKVHKDTSSDLRQRKSGLHAKKSAIRVNTGRDANEKEIFEAPFKKLSLAPRLLTKLLLRYTFLPTGEKLRAWVAFRVCIALIMAFTVTVHAAFLHTSITMWVINYLFDIICFADMYIKLHIAFYNDETKLLVTHPLHTAENFLKNAFIYDLAASFPLEIFAVAAIPHFSSEAVHIYAMTRLNRLLHVYRIPLAFDYLESRVDKQTGNIRMIKFGFYILVFLNTITCLLYCIACPPVLELNHSLYIENAISQHHCLADSWIAKTSYNISTMSIGEMYAISFYWGTATAVSVGYGEISAHTEMEMVVSLICMIMGVMFFGYIIASVAAGLANADALRARFQEKITAITRYIKDQDLDDHLLKRVISHYDYVWVRTDGADPESLFDGLPAALFGDVTLSLYEDIIRKSSLFQHTDVGFMKMLSRVIKPLLVRKGEYIVRKYDIGNEMYFIDRGMVDVVSEDGKTVFDTMKSGRFFGEVALLFKVPRTASVRARTNCDLFILTKKTLDEVLELYPDIKTQIMTVANQRKQQAAQRSAQRVLAEMYAEEEGEANIRGRRKSSVSAPPTEAPIKEEDENINQNHPIHPEKQYRQSVDVGYARYSDSESEEEAPPQPWMQKLWEQLLTKNRFVADPTSDRIKMLNNVMCILAIVSCMIIPYQVAYGDYQHALLAVNYIIDVIFLFEIYMKFHINFYDNYGDLVEDFDQVYTHYLKNPSGFAVDLIAALPIDIFALAAPSDLQYLVLTYLRLIHMIRLLRVFQFFSKWEKELNINVLFVRLSYFFFLLILMIHISSCLWYMIACPLTNCVSNTWADFEGLLSTSVTALDAYCSCVYWTVATMTSTGYGDIHAHTILEMCYASLVMVMGKLMFGFILGNIASTLANTEASRVKYDEKVNAVKVNMEDQGVPANLQKRVVDYYEYLWLRTSGVEIKEMFRETPPCLLAEIHFGIAKDMLQAIPLFTGATEAFMRTISLRINQVLFQPGDLIIRQGDMGNQVSYVHSGQVDVLTEDDPPKVADVLGPGSVYEDDNLVFDQPHRMTTRARTHVDILTLSKKDLDDVIHFFPEVQAAMHERCQELFRCERPAEKVEKMKKKRKGDSSESDKPKEQTEKGGGKSEATEEKSDGGATRSRRSKDEGADNTAEKLENTNK